MSGPATLKLEVRAHGDWTEVPYEAGAIEVEDRVEERALARWTSVVEADLARDLLVQGARVRITDTGADKVIFFGEVDTPNSERVPYSTYERVDVQAVNAHAIADNRVVRETYLDTRAGVIVRDVVDAYLAEEGITYTVDSIEDGPTIRETVLNYVPASEALRKLAEETGFTYYIDPELVLYFLPRDRREASEVLTYDRVVGGNVAVRRANTKYRNRQYLKGAQSTTDVITETFAGDDERTSVGLRYPIAKVPTVRVNGAEVSVGIKGLDDGDDWYWNKGDATLSQDDAHPPLPSGDTVEVEYQGQFDMVARAEAEGERERMAAITGGTGLVEAAQDTEPLANRDAVMSKAGALLDRWARRGRTVDVTLREPLYSAGELAPVYLPEDGIEGSGGAPLRMLAQSVVVLPEPRTLAYRYTFAEGYSEGSWAQVFRDIAREGTSVIERLTVGEESVLQLLHIVEEETAWSSSTDVHIFACPAPSDTLYPAADLYPC